MQMRSRNLRGGQKLYDTGTQLLISNFGGSLHVIIIEETAAGAGIAK